MTTTNIPTIRFKKLNPDAKMFEKATKYAVGSDMYSLVDEQLPPRKVTLIPTGIAVELPNWLEGQVRCRSGLAKQGIMVANSIGTIDSDYRGDVGVLLYNSTDNYFKINKGDRIAQFVISPILDVVFKEAVELEATDRGEAGFGSTGVSESIKKEKSEE